MKSIFGIIAVLMFVFSVLAQSNSTKAEREILDLRTKIREAVAKKDETALKKYFAEGFLHTHASGKVDGKAERIAFFLKGEPTIEDVEPDEIKVTVLNKNTAITTGKTTLLFGTEKRTFQWTGFFFKQNGKWLVAATHATLIRN